MDSGAFNDWRELRDCIVNGYGLEDAIIRLQQDFSKGSAGFCYGDRHIIDSSTDAVLLAMNIGYRVRLSIHLVRSEIDVLQNPQWRPRADFVAMLRCAKSIFERTVRDRVVDLMSQPEDAKVVSFFLDDGGKVELASSNARCICEQLWDGETVPRDFLPESFWDYARFMHRSLISKPKGVLPSKSSVVYCYYNDRQILNCLLQKMGPNGSLLCLFVNE